MKINPNEIRVTSQAPDEMKIQLLNALAILHPLEDFEIVGFSIEDAKMALCEEGGLTDFEYARILKFAKIWDSLPKRLKRMYLKALRKSGQQEDACFSALMRVFGISQRPASGATYGILRKLWIQMYGYPPSIELVPVTNSKIWET